MSEENVQMDDLEGIGAIRNVDFLKHLKDELIQNPHAYQIRYFSRGEILDRDSNESEWVYIIKSGSVSVMKKLRAAQPRSLGRRIEDKNELNFCSDAERVAQLFSNREMTIYNSTYEMEKRLEQTLPGYLNHADRLGVVPYDEIVDLHRRRVRRRAVVEVPQIILPASPTEDSLPSEEAKSPRIEKMSPLLPPIRKTSRGTYFSKGWPHNKTMNLGRKELHKLYAKKLPQKDSVAPIKGTVATRARRTDHLPRIRAKRKPNISTGCNSAFLSVQVLEKGEYFGINSLLRKDQPSLSLVSNGAECILISKRFLHQHLDPEILDKLRVTENHHPRSAEMQRKMNDLVSWMDGRKKIYSQLVHDKLSKVERRKEFHPHFIGEYCFRNGPE